MRTTNPFLILASPTLEGTLGAAALARHLGTGYDVVFLLDSEFSRRLFGLADDPCVRAVHVVDVVPTDSIGTSSARPSGGCMPAG